MMKEREVEEMRITKNGNLTIARGDDCKEQACPFCSNTESSLLKRCGDWCPHFGEPEYQNNRVFLSLCAGTTLCTREGLFTDRRDK